MPKSPVLTEKRKRYVGLPVQIKYAVGLTLVAGFTLLSMIFVMAWFIQRNYSLFMGDELGISAQVIEIVHHEQKLLELSLFILFLASIVVMWHYNVTCGCMRKAIGPVSFVFVRTTSSRKSKSFSIRSAGPKSRHQKRGNTSGRNSGHSPS